MTTSQHDRPLASVAPVSMVFDPQGDLLESALECESDVFDAQFGDGREVMDEWFASHAHVSVFLSLVDDEGTTVATSRLIAPGPDGLKFDQSMREDWQLDPREVLASVDLDPATTWEVATISVRPRRQQVGVMWTAALIHGLFEATRVNGATAAVAVLDEGARGLVQRLGVRWLTLPGCATLPYCGSPATTPVYMDLAEHRTHQRVTAPEAYRLVTLGEGLDGVRVLRGDEFRLRRQVLDLREPAPVSIPAPRV